jgi:hypothetical protein
MSDFDHIKTYLALDEDYQPDPQADPVQFLTKHLYHLPPELASLFSSVTNPKQRTLVPAIRNRRLKYADSHPPELSFNAARSSWPNLWHGRNTVADEAGKEERRWVEDCFLPGETKHVGEGKLAGLLSAYEQEREAERVHVLRQEHANGIEEEEDSDSDDSQPDSEQESEAGIQLWFERTIKERFIYGLLTVCSSL